MPKIVDHEHQRRSIATAAVDVIDVSGLEGMRLRDVAAAADVTTGAVTHYFDGKEAVLEAAMDLIVARILEKQTQTVSAQDTDPLRAAEQFLPIDAESRRDWRVWLAFWGRAVVDENLRARNREYYRRMSERLAADLEAQAPKKFTRRTARIAADAMIAAIDGIGTRATLEPDDWPPRRQRETLHALLSPLFGGATTHKKES